MILPVHLFSVDVEEHFQVSAFDSVLSREQWVGQPSRVVPNTDRLLELLDRHGARGTFFTLGWVAERHPSLVRRIADAGHEVGSHTWWHRKVTSQTAVEFREEIDGGIHGETKTLVELFLPSGGKATGLKYYNAHVIWKQTNAGPPPNIQLGRRDRDGKLEQAK